LIHAWYIIAKYPEQDYDYVPIDDERGERAVYVSPQQPRGYGTQGPPQSGPRPQQQQSKPRKNQQAPLANASGPAGSSHDARSEQEGAPPSYTDVIKGDNKIQSQH